jgi:hypothetical protein
MYYREDLQVGSRYLGGWEVDFNNVDDATRFVKTQGVNKKGFDFFRRVQAGLELNIAQMTIKKLYEHRDNGDGIEKTLLEENIPLPISDWIDHKLFFLQKEKGGNHRIGGKKPRELLLPVTPQTKTPMQYIGTIDCAEPAFSWMKQKELHIVFPLYECSFGVYLDCSDPLQPKLIKPISISEAWEYNDLEMRSKAEFLEARYRYTNKVKVNDIIEGDSDDVLICGVSLWYQQPEIPLCPVTGECMQFVCTINSDSELKLAEGELRESLGEQEYLAFGDHGHLFVFYHTISKIMHLNAQW